MKVAIIGSRGIPAAYGGFETFADELSWRLVEKGVETTVINQAGERSAPVIRGVRIEKSAYSKESNPVQFYRDSLHRAIPLADILLVCGVGGALFYPFHRAKKKILITHVDGREELRGKYSLLQKVYVRAAQKFAARFSTHLVVDSEAVKSHWQRTFRVTQNKISFIGFGAAFNPVTDDSIVSGLGLARGDYYLVICRMVPENHVREIIEGFKQSGSKRKLVLVGELTGEYGRQIGRTDEQIVFAGSLYDKGKTTALRNNAFAYLHGHSVGGTNPSLLESMAAGTPCICHDNEFNRETTANQMLYFKNVLELAVRIRKLEAFPGEERRVLGQKGRTRIERDYNWDMIAAAYKSLFEKLFHERGLRDS